LLAAAVTVVVSRSLARPIGALSTVATALAAGRVRADEVQALVEASTALPAESRSEVHEMTRAFAEMVDYQVRTAAAAESIAAGDIGISVAALSGDDVLGSAFVAMVAYLTEIAAAMQALAAGDLTVDVHPRSSLDQLGVAGQRMVESLRSI